MSGSPFITLTPPPVPLGAMGSSDVEHSWGIDMTANMTQRGTTIISIGTPVVNRHDGQTIDGSDLVITAATATASPTNMWINGQSVVVQAGYGFTFLATANGNATLYDIGFPLTLANGDKVTKWVTIPTLAELG